MSTFHRHTIDKLDIDHTGGTKFNMKMRFYKGFDPISLIAIAIHIMGSLYLSIFDSGFLNTIFKLAAYGFFIHYYGVISVAKHTPFYIAFFILLGMLKMPSFYYEFLRILVFTYAVGAVYFLFQKISEFEDDSQINLKEFGFQFKKYFIIIIMLPIAIIFNPIIQFHFDKDIWIVIDLFAAGFVLLSLPFTISVFRKLECDI